MAYGSGRHDRMENNPSVDKKLRRRRLKCAICPPNRGENAKRKPRHGKAKPKSKQRRQAGPDLYRGVCAVGCAGCAAE